MIIDNAPAASKPIERRACGAAKECDRRRLRGKITEAASRISEQIASALAMVSSSSLLLTFAVFVLYFANLLFFHTPHRDPETGMLRAKCGADF